MQKVSLRVFYSWQSDLKEISSKVIESCIKKAFLPVEEQYDSISLSFDEATRGESGSPDIPSTIFNKISAADIFIGDVTTINSSENANRRTPTLTS